MKYAELERVAWKYELLMQRHTELFKEAELRVARIVELEAKNEELQKAFDAVTLRNADLERNNEALEARVKFLQEQFPELG